MQNKLKGPALIAITAILWSFGGLLIKLISWDAMTIVGIRAAIAAVVMAVYMKKPRITFSLPVILGGVSLSATTILFVFANKLTTSANAIILEYTAPIFIIILSVLFLKKRVKKLDVIAVFVVFIGIALFFFDQLGDGNLLGIMLGLISGITFAGVFLMNQMPNSKPEESVLLGNIINAVAAIPFIVTNVTFEFIPWMSIALLGIFQLGLAYVLFAVGIKNTPPVFASLIAALEPLLNPVWVLLFTGEKPGNWAIVGGVIVIATIAVYSLLSGRRAASSAKELNLEN